MYPPRNTPYLFLLIVGCNEPEATCAALCPEFTRARGACLAERGLSWSDAGYGSAQDHQIACETWAWEQAQIARSQHTTDTLRGACSARATLLANQPSCVELDDWDWNLARSEPVSDQ